jgi:hypothetical protein
MAAMPNILIAEGTPAVWQAERAGFGLPSNFSLFAAAVQLHHPGIRCTLLNIADGEVLPFGTTLSDFDGVMVPGSPLHIYDPTPCVSRQIDFARAALSPACLSGAAAGACNLQRWRLGDQFGATRGDASCRSLGRLP